MSFLKKALKKFDNAFVRSLSLNQYHGTKDMVNHLFKQYPNDFKNWYDGTDAQRKANELNRQNWEMQNAYNTPEAQMARFEAAGLNPNLIYSQSNEAGSIASVSPAMSGGEVLSKAAQTIASFYSIAGMIADVKNKQQQNKNLATQDLLLSAQADYTQAMADRFRIDNGWLRDNNTSSLEPSFIRSGKGLIDWMPRVYFNMVDKLDSVGHIAYDKAYKYGDPYYYGRELGRKIGNSVRRYFRRKK